MHIDNFLAEGLLVRRGLAVLMFLACLSICDTFSDFVAGNTLGIYEFCPIVCENLHAPKAQESVNGGSATKGDMDGGWARRRQSKVAWRRTIHGWLAHDSGEIGTSAAFN